MKNRNIYKDIVTCAVICALAAFFIKIGKACMQELKFYGFVIQSETELTADMGKELQNISGICQFEPMDTASVTIRLEEYTLETELMGINLEEYPLKWKDAKEKIILGNTAALFFGESSFSSFVDKNGCSPGKNQIQSWIAGYQELSLTITDETGRVQKAGIFGILAEPQSRVCMDKSQMKEIFGDSARTTGGYMKIQGNSNTKKAKKLLESSGFLVE